MRNIACFQIKVKRDILRKYRTYGELYMGLCKVTGEVPIAIYRTEKRRIFIEEVIHLTMCMFIKYWNFNHCRTFLPLQSTVIMWYETLCNIYTDIKYICIIMKNNSSFKINWCWIWIQDSQANALTAWAIKLHMKINWHGRYKVGLFSLLILKRSMSCYEGAVYMYHLNRKILIVSLEESASWLLLMLFLDC